MSSQNSISKTQKLRHVASKIMLKTKSPKGKENMDSVKLDLDDKQVARFVSFTRPAAAPQIIDLKALRQALPPQPTLTHVHHSREQRSQADLSRPELRLQRSFETPRSPTETGTPLRKNPQQAFVFEATSSHSAVAALDDLMDHAGYELLDDEDSYMDWSLLDLPENIYGRLAYESRHSLI